MAKVIVDDGAQEFRSRVLLLAAGTQFHSR
jgi:hypothetical protein